eukprot:gene1187-1365_t
MAAAHAEVIVPTNDTTTTAAEGETPAAEVTPEEAAATLAAQNELLHRTSLFSNFTKYNIAWAMFGVGLIMVTVIMFIIGFLGENETIIFSGIITSPLGFLIINHSIHLAYRRSRRVFEELQAERDRNERGETSPAADPATIPSKLEMLSIDIACSPSCVPGPITSSPTYDISIVQQLQQVKISSE